MIPQRVKLKGFLCYKDEQTVEFDGNATLWMLSGLNGSGKSTIFDAITYALFGAHRGGVTGAHELINKDADTLTVEFDFLLDGRPYRSKRTLRRNTQGGARGTQQLLECQSTGEWAPVPDTERKAGFDAWVQERIGLDYNTFTSSVLLLQGKAEKLLDSKPEGRREVLAGIVDLERYERLFQKADAVRKEKEAELKAISARLAALEPVEPLALEAARAAIVDADAARQEAGQAVERLQAVEYQAQAWQDLQKRLNHGRTRVQRARAVLQEAGAIEQAVARLRELREVFPRLNEIVILRGQNVDAAARLKVLEREKATLNESIADRRNALAQSATRKAELNRKLAADDVANREVGAQLRKTGEQLTRLREAESQEHERDRVRDELAALPADPTAAAAAAREAFDRVEALARVVPVLARFQTLRTELTDTVAGERTADTRLQAIRVRGEGLKAQTEELRGRLDSATRALERASAAATEARTLLQQARESLDELSRLEGAKTCRHCGQPLTAGHLAEEGRRRTAAVADAERRATDTGAAETAARQAADRVRAELSVADKARDDARDEFRDAQSQLKNARALIDRLRDDLSHQYDQLPEAYRARVGSPPPADWLTTAYPTDADLQTLRTQARDLEAARRRLKDAEATQLKWSKLKTKETTVLDALERLLRDLPRDRDRLRRDHADLETRQMSLFKSLDSAREALKQVEAEADAHTRARDKLQADLSKAETGIKEQQLVQQNAERGIQAMRKLLPGPWQAQADSVGIKELQSLKAEQDRLDRDRTEERGHELEHARHHLAELERDVRELEGQQSAFPPEVREEPAILARRLADARERHAGCDAALADARHQHALLDSIVQQRKALDDEYRQREGTLAADRRLAELLGKDRLQLYLVRQAERQVVEYANAVLDRLSGGQLYLRLAGEAAGDGATAKALDLEAYNRTTGERPINVAFLSGSQKFRVAVSLALGIGQYASRRHRPIESVIIDEGFGCLDSQGRQVMIQELQNLRSQMRCILLVSHQEDFAESFSDGYQFRLENGATKVERIRK
ncbi:MAG: SMC family ATPase [Gemmataceae bacterium]